MKSFASAILAVSVSAFCQNSCPSGTYQEASCTCISTRGPHYVLADNKFVQVTDSLDRCSETFGQCGPGTYRESTGSCACININGPHGSLKAVTVSLDRCSDVFGPCGPGTYRDAGACGCININGPHGSLKAVRTETIKEDIANAGYGDFAGRMFRTKKYNYEWAHNGNGELVVVRTGGDEGRTQFNRQMIKENPAIMKNFAEFQQTAHCKKTCDRDGSFPIGSKCPTAANIAVMGSVFCKPSTIDVTRESTAQFLNPANNAFVKWGLYDLASKQCAKVCEEEGTYPAGCPTATNINNNPKDRSTGYPYKTCQSAKAKQLAILDDSDEEQVQVTALNWSIKECTDYCKANGEYPGTSACTQMTGPCGSVSACSLLYGKKLCGE